MPVWVRDLQLDQRNRRHLIDDKGAFPYEVAEVVYQTRYRHYSTSKGDCIYVYGRTENGRLLVIVLKPLSGGIYRPMTAWDMNGKERQLYTRKVR